MAYYRFKIVGILFFMAFAIPAYGLAIMFLWNALIPSIIPGVMEINFIQAVGLVLLSKLLFGGFGGGKHHVSQRSHWKHKFKNKWKQKWENMSEEDRHHWKEQFGKHCGPGKWKKRHEKAGTEAHDGPFEDVHIEEPDGDMEDAFTDGKD